MKKGSRSSSNIIVLVVIILICCCCYSITTNIILLLIKSRYYYNNNYFDDPDHEDGIITTTANFVDIISVSSSSSSSILDNNTDTNNNDDTTTKSYNNNENDDNDHQHNKTNNTPIYDSNFNDDEEETRRTVVVPIISQPPSINNTIIVLIAMGLTYETFVVERCIRSIRTSGSYNGPILVLIDSHMSYKRYNETILSRDDSNVILWIPKHYNNPFLLKPDDDEQHHDDELLGQRIKMGYKRYKTLLPEILDECCSNRHLFCNSYYRYLLYLDIDNAIADKLQYLFDDIKNLLAAKQKQQTKQSSSFLLQFQDPGQTNKVVWHTGVMLIDRYHSRQCLKQWRDIIDSANPNEIKSDQQLLLKSLNSSSLSNNNCYIHPIPIDKNFALPDKTILDWKSKGHYNHKYPVVVHITNTHRIYKIPVNIQSQFLRTVLHISDVGGNKKMMMTDTISWKSVATIQKFHVPLNKKEEKGNNNNIFYQLLQQLRGSY